MPREALPDHYAVLGVPSDADPAAIKAAFRQRALGTHPDKGLGTHCVLYSVDGKAWEWMRPGDGLAAWDVLEDATF